MTTDYASFKNANLTAECKMRGLPYSGNKATLVARLIADDTAKAEAKAAEAKAKAEAEAKAKAEALAKATEDCGAHLKSRMNELVPFMVDTPYKITENTKLDTASCEYVAQAAKEYTAEEHRAMIDRLTVTNITTEELVVTYAVNEALKLTHMFDLPRIMDREKGNRITAKVVVTHKRSHKEWDKKKRKTVKVFKPQTIAEFPLIGLDYDRIATKPLAKHGWKKMDTAHWTAYTPTTSTEKDYEGVLVPDKDAMSVTEYFNKCVKRVYRSMAFGFIAPDDQRGNAYTVKIIVQRKA